MLVFTNKMSIINMNTHSNRNKKNKSIVTRVLSFRKSKNNKKETGDQSNSSSSSKITKDDATSSRGRRLFKTKDQRRRGTIQGTKKRAKGSVMDTYQAVVDKCILLRSSSSSRVPDVADFPDKSTSSSQHHSKSNATIQDLEHQVQVLKFDNIDLRRRLQDTIDQLSTVLKEKDVLENELLNTQVYPQAEARVLPESAYEIINEGEEHLMITNRYHQPPETVAFPVIEEPDQRQQEGHTTACVIESFRCDNEKESSIQALTEEEEEPQLIFLNREASLLLKEDLLVVPRSQPSDCPVLFLDESQISPSQQQPSPTTLQEAFVVQILLDDEHHYLENSRSNGPTSNKKPECNGDDAEPSQQRGRNQR